MSYGSYFLSVDFIYILFCFKNLVILVLYRLILKVEKHKLQLNSYVYLNNLYNSVKYCDVIMSPIDIDIIPLRLLEECSNQFSFLIEVPNAQKFLNAFILFFLLERRNICFLCQVI